MLSPESHTVRHCEPLSAILRTHLKTKSGYTAYRVSAPRFKQYVLKRAITASIYCLSSSPFTDPVANPHPVVRSSEKVTGGQSGPDLRTRIRHCLDHLTFHVTESELLPIALDPEQYHGNSTSQHRVTSKDEDSDIFIKSKSVVTETT